jgi:hypothetical protein
VPSPDLEKKWSDSTSALRWVKESAAKCSETASFPVTKYLLLLLTKCGGLAVSSQSPFFPWPSNQSSAILGKVTLGRAFNC